ncbi:MAG: hypothetical protein AB1758_15980 [Candidatus Eremiobacterota bacterium]
MLATTPQSTCWTASLERAEFMGTAPDRLTAFLEDVCVPLERATTKGPLTVHGPMLSEFFMYVLGYAHGCYPGSPDTVRLMVAALDFALAPRGERPDGVLGWVLSQVRSELQSYRAWRNGH